MKIEMDAQKRSRWFWMGMNSLVLLAMLTALVFPVPMVHAQDAGSSSMNLSPQTGGLLLDNRKPQSCQEGDHCALHFNGINQWVEEGEFRGFDTAHFTLETWVNWSGEGTPIPEGNALFSGQIPIIAIGGDSSNDSPELNLLLGIDPASGGIFIGFHAQPTESNPEGEYYSLTGTTELTTAAWHHIAATFDGQILRLYLDGTLDAELDLGEPVVADLVSVRQVTLAAALPGSDGGMGFFKGSLDEVRIWESARTQPDLLSTANLEGISDPNLIGYWMMNEGKGSELKDSSRKGKNGVTQNDPTWTDGAPMMLSAAPVAESLPSIDAAPNGPTLVSPSDGATNVSTSPSLNVTVSDPDLNNLTVTYYGRAATVSQPDFTFIIIPDTQKYVTPPPGNGIFQQQTQWVASQRSLRNIVFSGHLGDSVDDWNVPDQWAVTNAAMINLENAGIPYAIAPGNCDLDHYGVPPDTTFFNTYFPVSRFAGRTYYGGAYNNDNTNSYQLISASGLNFIIIEIKYNVSYNTTQGQAILAWANNLLQLYSNRRAVVITHNLLTTSNVFSTDGAMIYNALKGNPNLFLMLGGHLDTEGMRTDPGTDGHTIYSLRSDYQTRANGGNGWLRIMRFSPDNNKIYVTTYSPYLNQFETDASSQFDLDYNMGGAGFDTLGSVTVPSGSTASITWPGLAAETQYQWYVTVNDGTSTTTGPIWNFTTSGGLAAPVVTTQPASQTVNAGQTASFTAAASGSPTPTVQWQVSTNNGSTWNDISGATSASYSFTAQSSDNGRQFRAAFTNSSGSATTNAAILTVYTSPAIATQPVSQTVTAGLTATFTAGASGNPVPAVQWQVSTDNGATWTNISGATSSTYSFTTLSADNGKRYRAVFTNAAGSATTNSATLTVNYVPAITTQPVNQIVNSGQVASFTAGASGNPTPTIQWQVSTDGGSSWSNITGATVTTYSFTTVSGDNGKQYRAVFTNSVGSVITNAVLLAVNTGPVITLQPIAVTVIAGQSASFTANAGGTPTPTVKWQMSTNGTTWSDISGATSTTYTFTTSSLDNGKQYRAVFSNTVGTATSNAAILTVQTPPVVTTQPANQVVNAGQAATFTAGASGNPAPTVQWQASLDGGSSWTNITGATSITYSFVAVSGDNGKQYRAVFTNVVGSTTTNSALLTVNTGPVITTQPANLTVNTGQTATFSAAATGNPTPTVQWQVSTNGTTWSDISSATSTTYTFTTLSVDNGKQYRAVFTNTAGSATTTAATLTVQTPPVVTTQPANQAVNAGQTASFTSAASGNPVPSVQWQVSLNGSTWSDIPGATSATLSFSNLADDNGKQYHAVFTNAAGLATSNSATLTVYTAPVVTLQPVYQTVVIGKFVSFVTAASGNPTPSIQWQSSTDGVAWSNISGATSTTYTFTPIAEDNGKQFRAVFTNSVGSATSNNAILTVYFGPVITLQPASLSLIAGQIATFTVAAVGNPMPAVHWEVSVDGLTWTNLAGETSTTLTFTTQISDNGKRYRAYFINAVSEVASSSALLTVTLANVPPTVTLNPVDQTVTESQTATFTATASGTPVPTVQWQVSTNGTTWTDIPGATGTGYSFTPSAADTGKHYRAVFTNIAGSATTSGAVLTVRTLPVVTLQPANLTVNAGQTATFTSAASGNPSPTVQWQVSLDGANWTDIPGATSGTLSFTAQATDTGKIYRATFTNAAGSTTSNTAVLTVNIAPTITSQPGSQTVNAGQTATFTADAAGNPTPSVQWMVSTDNGATWSPVPGETSKSYNFTAAAGDNGKRYRAVFTNAAGSATTSAAILIVNTAPVITTQPINLTVNAGQTASFTAMASGNPAPTIQWQASPDGTTWGDIAGATSTSLSFTAQAADNGKQYRVVFTNAAGSVYSNTATLTVQSAPAITTQPTNQTVTSGQIATFTASATGNPVPTVQWQSSTDGINWSNIPGATSIPYSFTAQAADNGKRIRVVFTNAVGSATSTAATLIVQFAPQATLQPQTQTVTAGQGVTFQAAADGNPAPTVQWQVSIDNGSSWTNIAGATTITYSFTTAAADNGKQYQAVFTNLIGSITTNAAILTVNFAPQVTTQPASLSMTAGQTASFTSAASGNPLPSVQWQSSPDGSTWTNIAGANAATYSFTAQAADNGKSYRAVFTNSVGSATSNAALLTVTSDLIFADDFNTCNANAWNGGLVNPSRLAFNTASGRNSTCGMAVTVQSSIAAYVVDNNPNNETSFNARFYFMPNTLKMPNNSPITLLEANNAAGSQVVAIQLRWSGKTMQLRAGSLSDANAWTYTNWTTIANTWHSIEVDWNASSSSTANDGSLTFWIDGIQEDLLSGLNNDVHSIHSVYLGAVAGLTNKMSGSFFIDDYESRRSTMIGQ